MGKSPEIGASQAGRFDRTARHRRENGQENYRGGERSREANGKGQGGAIRSGAGGGIGPSPGAGRTKGRSGCRERARNGIEIIVHDRKSKENREERKNAEVGGVAK